MPHFIIEFSEESATDERIGNLMDSLYHAAVASELFEPDNIKVRMHPLRYYTSANSRDSFIHAQLRIHNGRTPEQKKMLSDSVLATIREQHWPVKRITVEVVDMDKDSYSKYTADQ